MSYLMRFSTIKLFLASHLLCIMPIQACWSAYDLISIVKDGDMVDGHEIMLNTPVTLSGSLRLLLGPHPGLREAGRGAGPGNPACTPAASSPTSARNTNSTRVENSTPHVPLNDHLH